MVGKVIYIFVLIKLASATDSRQQKAVNHLLLSLTRQGYNPNVRPAGDESLTFVTRVNFSISGLNVFHMDVDKELFSFVGYFNTEWMDPRLKNENASIRYLPINEHKGQIWIPDIYAKEAVEYGTFPSNSNARRTVRIYPDGRVFHSVRFTLTILCPALRYFSKKTFVCPMRVGPFAYTEDELIVVSSQESIRTTDGGGLVANFVLQGLKFRGECDGNSTGSFREKQSCVQFDFEFSREFVMGK